MLIDREEYLTLVGRLQLVQQDNQLLTRENEILAAELEKQKCLNYELIHKLGQIRECSTALNDKVIHQNEVHHHDLKGYITQLDQKQKQYLDAQFQHLETSAFEKYKVLQIKNTASRIENHELLDFVEKIKKLYKKGSTEQKEPSLKDMVKWVKNFSSLKSNVSMTSPKKATETGTTWKGSVK